MKEKMQSIYSEGIIEDRLFRIWLVKFHSGRTLKNKPRKKCLSDFNDSILKGKKKKKTYVKSTKCLAERLNLSKLIVNQHLEKLRNVNK